MRIGLNGAARTVDEIVEHAVAAEAAGFSSLWFTSQVMGDPLVAIALAGRATTRIELGTAVLQTYTCHPVLMARRAAAVAMAMARTGFTLGLGPSHAPLIEPLGFAYDHPGRHTEEYLRVVTAALHGDDASIDGDEFRIDAPAGAAADPPVTVLLAALGGRTLRVAGETADGTVLWLANTRALESHVVPRISAAATAAGRPAPRVVAGLPVAVHDDVDEALAVAAEQFAFYGSLPNYVRILERGGVSAPADTAVVGDEAAVAAQVRALFDAGATDVWAAVFGVGSDRRASRERTRALLAELATGD